MSESACGSVGDRQRVRRRLVCYLSGFDPKGPGHYHRLFVEEGRKQAALGGYELTVGPRQRSDELVSWWEVKLVTGNETVHTRYEFWRWDDIVRQEWPTGRLAVLQSTLRASVRLWFDGVFPKVLRLSWPAFIASAGPGLVLILWAGMALSGVVLAAWWAGHDRIVMAGATLAAVLACGWGLWQGVLHHLQAGWLMRSLDSLVRLGQGRLPQLVRRLDHFSGRLVDQLSSSDADEVLVVGHSSGAMLAMSIVAGAARRWCPHGSVRKLPRLSLLTIGHCTPMLALQQDAAWFRADLAELVTLRGLPWIDYTAPPDGCCFALVDPSRHADAVAVTPARPKLLNAKFAMSFDAATYRSVRGDKFRCHFQYLMAGTRLGDYDFHLMTCGPMDLATRHAMQTSITGFKQFQRFGAAQ